MKEKESLKDLLKRIFLQSAGCFGSTIVNILKGFVMVGIFLFVQSIIPESPDRELKYSQRVINKAKRATVAYLNDYDNVIDFPELNESREVLNRMAGDEWFDRTYDNIVVEDPNLTNNEITIYSYNYGKAYKKAKKETDKIIKEDNIESKKEKNEVLNKNLVKECSKILDNNEKVSHTVYKRVDVEGRYRYVSVVKLSNQENNMDLHNALVGGLIDAMEKDPCDYLIIRDEYKYYEELTKMLRSWEKDCKEAIAKGNIEEDDMKAREIMSAFYVESTGDVGKDVENELKTIGFSITEIDPKKHRIYLMFDSKDYEYGYEQAHYWTDLHVEDGLSQEELNKRFTEYMTKRGNTIRRVNPKEKFLIAYNVIYDENGECHYKLSVDESDYDYFLGNLRYQIWSYCKYDVVEREKYVDKRKQEIEEIKERVRREREAEVK